MTTGRYAFLATRRWWGIIAVIVLVSIVCALLGYWQLTRYQTRAEQVNLVETNYEAEPVALGTLLDGPQGELAGGDEWRPVQLRGEYLSSALVLPQRGVAGSPADHVVAMFAAQGPDGQQWLLLVDRGWYRTDSFADNTAAEQLPEGQVEVVLRLRTAESPSPRVLAEGQVHSLNPAQVADLAGEQHGEQISDEAALVTGVYGRVASEAQGGVSTLPQTLQVLPRPPADLGSHLSYAFQWWVFSLGALVGLVVLARREAADTFGPRGPGRPRGPQRRRTPTEDEDELIEAQLARPRLPTSRPS